MAAIVRAAQQQDWAVATASVLAAVTEQQAGRQGPGWPQEQGITTQVLDHKGLRARGGVRRRPGPGHRRLRAGPGGAGGFMRIPHPGFVVALPAGW